MLSAPRYAADATGSINLTSTTAGKVALVANTTLLTGNCPVMMALHHSIRLGARWQTLLATEAPRQPQTIATKEAVRHPSHSVTIPLPHSVKRVGAPTPTITPAISLTPLLSRGTRARQLTVASPAVRPTSRSVTSASLKETAAPPPQSSPLVCPRRRHRPTSLSISPRRTTARPLPTMTTWPGR